MSERANKIVDLAAVLDGLGDGATLAIGGSMFHNKPMALVREIVRRQIRDLTLIAVPQASIDVDLLIGAGCVAEVRVPYLGFDHLGLAPSFRRRSAAGEIRTWDCDETQLIAALDAAARDVPSGTVKTGVGTDLPRINPDLHLTADPITGEELVAVAAMHPDFTILHASAGDRNGNLRYTGYPFADLMLAEATKRQGGTVVASIEEILPATTVDATPFVTVIAHFLIDRVSVVPYGAHPCSSHGDYGQDEDALRAYISAARAGEPNFATYLQTTVLGPARHEEYLDAVLTPSRLLELRSATRV